MSDLMIDFSNHNEKVLSQIVRTDYPKDSRFIDHSGQKFGLLTVIRFAGKDKHRSSKYWCRCDCGSPEKLIDISNLKANTISCGCVLRKKTIDRNTTHGLTNDPWYHIAYLQQGRMTDPSNLDYPNYGGRGLTFGEGMETVVERVLFYREFFGSVRPKGMEIDRIDNNRGYAKDNVRLVNRTMNNLNRRDSHGHACDGAYSRTYKTWTNWKVRGWLVYKLLDFKEFLKAVGIIPDGMYLARKDVTRKLSEDNFFFSEKIQNNIKYKGIVR